MCCDCCGVYCSGKTIFLALHRSFEFRARRLSRTKLNHDGSAGQGVQSSDCLKMLKCKTQFHQVQRPTCADSSMSVTLFLQTTLSIVAE